MKQQIKKKSKTKNVAAFPHKYKLQKHMSIPQTHNHAIECH
jgi:hypothetical protein